MQELTDLLTKVTQGDWLFVQNDDGNVSVCVRKDPTKLEEGSVFMEVGGGTPEEALANARLILLTKEAAPTLIDTNTKLAAALTAALLLMEKANVHVEGEEAVAVWHDLEAALGALGIAAEAVDPAAAADSAAAAAAADSAAAAAPPA